MLTCCSNLAIILLLLCSLSLSGYILELALLFMYASVCNNAGIVIEKKTTITLL